ncbi:MAG: L-threonylcarbamoyladenylate synthase [bacterium]
MNWKGNNKEITILKCDTTHPDMEIISLAAEVIKNGGIIAYPTDTVYGLGGNPFFEQVRKKIYQIKKRPLHKALPLIIGHRNMLTLLCTHISSLANKLMDIFWPGALTIIIPDGKGSNIGVRWPNHPIAEKLSLSSHLPLIGTSANISGNQSIVDPAQIIKELGDKIDLVIDSGTLPPSRGSTIVDVTQNTINIIREGEIPAANLKLLMSAH